MVSAWCGRCDVQQQERFLAEADRYFEQYLRKIGVCVALLSEQQVWWRPNESCNSVGNLLLHLRGNLSQWVLAALGGQAYERHRAAEFRARQGQPKDELMEGLAAVVEKVRAVVAGLDGAALERAHHVQGYDTDGLGVVFHVVEHMSYHTGQIVAATKQLIGPDAAIEFYPQHRNE
jgi:uncharacterized damage-inducible protein DinB